MPVATVALCCSSLFAMADTCAPSLSSPANVNKVPPPWEYCRMPLRTRGMSVHSAMSSIWMASDATGASVGPPASACTSRNCRTAIAVAETRPPMIAETLT
eukprot:11287311-Alexandrium_andersonii.AAC.1